MKLIVTTDPHEKSVSNLHIRILYAASGRGLAMDAELLGDVLTSLGCSVEITTTSSWSVQQTRLSHRIAGVKKRLPARWVNWLERLQIGIQALGKPSVDLQIHLESPIIHYIGAATTNWLIPNQEWLRPQHVSYLSRFERILVKTDEALKQLTPFHPAVSYIGFSNPIAEHLPTIATEPQRFQRFLHVAGKNRKKGSAAIIDAWRRNPAWPVLHLVLDDIEPYLPLPPNITHWLRPDRQQLKRLHQHCGVVLAPSEVEGYGHILVESMAHQNLVVTTDAAPMNELVTVERGVLVGWTRQEVCHFGTRYFVSAEAIEAAVESVLQSPSEPLMAKALAAQQWVRANHQNFIHHLVCELQQWGSTKHCLSPQPKSVYLSSEQESHHA